MENKLSGDMALALLILLFVLVAITICVLYVGMSILFGDFNIFNWDLWQRITFLAMQVIQFFVWLKVLIMYRNESTTNGK